VTLLHGFSAFEYNKFTFGERASDTARPEAARIEHEIGGSIIEKTR
jgi:hypothetical protein